MNLQHQQVRKWHRSSEEWMTSMPNPCPRLLSFQVWRGILTLYSLLSLTLICFSQRRAVGRGGLLIQWNKNLLPPINGTCACGALRVGRSSRLPSWWNLAVRHQVLTGRLRDAKDDSVKARDTCSISVCWNAHDRWLDDLFFLSSGFCDRQRLRMKAGWSWQTRQQYLQ